MLGSTDSMSARFYYSISQCGAEKAVRQEILASHPELRSAFSRPGFITFKEESPLSGILPAPESVFSRVWGESIGQARSREEALALLRALPEGAVMQAFDRETFVPGDEPEGYVRNSRVQALLDRWEIRLETKTPRTGDWVYDWIHIDEGCLFLGRHLHREGLDPSPGNHPDIPLPAEAPSRAYLKLVEAVHRFHPELQKEMEVLEAGCSPGGATHAMLARGLRVTGIDPKRMDARVEKHPDYRHILKTARTATAEDLGGVNPGWLVLDMNLAPLEALDEVAHLIRLLRRTHGKSLRLREGLLTLKLNDWKFADQIPLYLKRVQELGFPRLKATQLCANRQEFFVYATGFR